MGLKAFSLLLAVVLAYAVNSERNASVVTIVVPIELKNLSSDKVVTRPAKRTVQVTIKGPSFILGSVASAPPPLKVMIPDQAEDRIPVTFNPSDLRLPPGVSVLGFEPGEMDFLIESMESREVKVEVPRIGHLPKHLVLDGLEVFPKSVVLKGPHSEIKSLRALETEPIDLREISETTSIDLAMRLPGTLTRASAERVGVRVLVSDVPIERTFKGRMVELRMPPGMNGLRPDPSEVSVTIAAPPTLVEEVNAADVIPFVRVRSTPVGREELSVEVEMPRGCRIVRVDPPKIALMSRSLPGTIKSKETKR
jgi:YbbR domain-containing protein